MARMTRSTTSGPTLQFAPTASLRHRSTARRRLQASRPSSCGHFGLNVMLASIGQVRGAPGFDRQQGFAQVGKCLAHRRIRPRLRRVMQPVRRTIAGLQFGLNSPYGSSISPVGPHRAGQELCWASRRFAGKFADAARLMASSLFLPATAAEIARGSRRTCSGVDQIAAGIDVLGNKRPHGGRVLQHPEIGGVADRQAGSLQHCAGRAIGQQGRLLLQYFKKVHNPPRRTSSCPLLHHLGDELIRFRRQSFDTVLNAVKPSAFAVQYL